MEFWLHFVGKGLYKQAVFEREAKRLGVQRSISFRQLGNMQFGDNILLAYHIRSRKEFLEGKVKDMRKVSTGVAEIFGYFSLEALVHNLPPELTERLYVLLDCECSGGLNQTEKRACGSYCIVAVCSCRNSLKKIIEAIKQACEKHKFPPKMFKFFLKGSYRPFQNSIVLSPATFTRGYFKVSIDNLSLETQEREPKNLVWILDYERRIYLKKEERQALDNRSLEEFHACNIKDV